ncbi:MAG: TraR/DksA C4-type zinc finger protein [Acidimicrobiia bacterium]|nr:TraR/DksA C4-type zinc finger protein [Acidimicrobiia bacterium]
MDPDAARADLEDERARLAAPPDPGSDASDLEEVEAELADVERALQRLDDGTYGVCEACGEPIDDERLAAHPATRACGAPASGC